MDLFDRKFVHRELIWRWDGERGKHILVGVPKTRSAHLLNPVAAKIFALCDGEHTVEDIVHELMQQYPESTERISSDVDGFVEYLGQLDIIYSSNGEQCAPGSEPD